MSVQSDHCVRSALLARVRVIRVLHIQGPSSEQITLEEIQAFCQGNPKRREQCELYHGICSPHPVMRRDALIAEVVPCRSFCRMS
jgi:hypothetical protein